MGPTKLGRAEKRWRVKPNKQKTWKKRRTAYRTDRLRTFLGYEPHKNRLRKTRKVYNAPKGAIDHTAFKGAFRWLRNGRR